MSVQEEQIIHVPLMKLSMSPHNVRATDASDVTELAASIRANQYQLLQNIVVHQHPSKKGHFQVCAGGRRLRALEWLMEQKEISAKHIIPCKSVQVVDAVAVSLAENFEREEMTPLEEIQSFRRLVDEGKDIESVASLFGTTPRKVKQYLALSNVHPSFLAMFAELTIEQSTLCALAEIPSQDEQLAVWNQLPEWQRNARGIRDLRSDTLPVANHTPLFKFVGAKAYKKAGGGFVTDLFEQEDGQRIADFSLVIELANKKLEAHATKLKEDGVKWVGIIQNNEFYSEYEYVPTMRRELTEEEITRESAIDQKMSALTAKIDEFEEMEELTDEQKAEWQKNCDEFEQLESEQEAFEATLCVPVPGAQELAGVVLFVDSTGKLVERRNVIRKSDAKALAKAIKTQAQQERTGLTNADGEPLTDDNPSEYSKKFNGMLMAQLSAITQNALRENPKVCMALFLSQQGKLMEAEEYNYHKPLNVSVQRMELSGPEEDPAVVESLAMQQHSRAFQAATQKLKGLTLAELADLPESELLELFALVVSKTFKSTSKETIARTVGLLNVQVPQWWRPAANNCFNYLKKPQIIEALREVGKTDAADKVVSLKKGEASALAEAELIDSGWLPSVMRF